MRCGVATREGAARELLRADPGNSNLRKSLEAAEKRLERVRIEAVQRFFEEFVSQVEVRIKDGDQCGLYKHLKGVDFEGKKSSSSQYIKAQRAVCFVTWGSFAIGGYSISALCSTVSRQRSTRISSKSSRYDPRRHLSMIYLRFLRWKKPSRACQTERLLDPMRFPLNCSNLP